MTAPGLDRKRHIEINMKQNSMSTDTTQLSAIGKLVIESEVRRLLAAYVRDLD
jgi:hypothetical protein